MIEPMTALEPNSGRCPLSPPEAHLADLETVAKKCADACFSVKAVVQAIERLAISNTSHLMHEARIATNFLEFYEKSRPA